MTPRVRHCVVTTDALIEALVRGRGLAGAARCLGISQRTTVRKHQQRLGISRQITPAGVVVITHTNATA